jgi:hypothetical protein
MRRAAIAAMAAAGLVLVHAVPAQAGGSQQELCAPLTSCSLRSGCGDPRSGVAAISDASESTSLWPEPGARGRRE